jgi:hypothetical protein
MVPKDKWYTITVDMITALPKSLNGFDSILVIVDKLTKMVHLVPTNETMDSQQFADLIQANVIRLHGAPKFMISDRGSVFHSKYAQAWADQIGIWQKFSSSYHPDTDGQTERANRVIEDVLRCFADTRQSEWDTFLPMAEFAMNNAPNEATKQTPFMLNYGVNPRHPDISKLVSTDAPLTPYKKKQKELAVTALSHTLREIADVPAATQFSDLMKQALKHTQILLEAARQRMIQTTNKKRTLKVPFKVGDYIMLNAKNIKLVTEGKNKLLPRFVGPFPIMDQINPVTFRVKLADTMQCHDIFHVNLFKLYKRREDIDPDDDEPIAIVIDGVAEYEVEALLGKQRKTLSTKQSKYGKKSKTEIQYLVKWQGYGPHHNEWVSEDELKRNCAELVTEYNLKNTVGLNRPRKCKEQ